VANVLACNARDDQSFLATFQRLISLIRTVSGAEGLEMVC